MLRICGRLYFAKNTNHKKRSKNIYTTAGLNEWIGIVREQMPQLSKPQAWVLALWSFGMVIAGTCGITSVTRTISELTEAKEANVRQRLREWNRSQAKKRGKRRRELVVTESFAPLLRWVLSWWAPDERRLLLAMDASTLGDRYVVLAISVVYRACAIPIAWQIYAFDRQSSWKPAWLALVAQFAGVIPADWTVLVLSDRGLYAQWLFHAIQALGWHPFLRINGNAHYRARAESDFHPVRQLANRHGVDWSGQVVIFKQRSLDCTLLVRWEAGYKDPWLILTDLLPDQATIAWYGCRSWIECGFRQTKRAGWQWHQTRMTDPDRAARHWLAIAVATLWVVSVGGQVDAALPASTLDPLETPAKPKPSHPRLLSCFRQGILTIRVALIKHEPLPVGRFFPDYAPHDDKPTL